MIPSLPIDLSGERFQVVYRLTGNEAEARARAQHICLEQTVEFPADLIPAGDIRDQIVGRIESFEQANEQCFDASISYAVETSGSELTQLLNVVFGNTSIIPGVHVERLELPDTLLHVFKGPRFGRAGLREVLNVPSRPLLCTALKPMGLPPRALADLAYQLALGGIDIIKDDHGLADQRFAPFKERVARCAEAVAQANRETGLKCIYIPNITGPADRIPANALFAKQAGAGGMLIAPGLVGLDTMRQLADEDRVALPIMSHPALQGSFVTHPHHGISHFALFGQIARLAGADASIYPNYGGRFSFSRWECHSIADGTAAPMAHIKPIFPAPGGGMRLDRVSEMIDLYGREVIFLIGGGLHQHGPDLVENCRTFQQLVERG
ncbi:MAG TPA: RuBisCO large subunit C-terminal-like domain-containing protein [Anaerolineae bacterium]|nr:RuBisCO large subunit C-terminal-like domain-containing protein [Anaerolineae bacterium]